MEENRMEVTGGNARLQRGYYHEIDNKGNEIKTDKILTGPLGLLTLLASRYNLKALISTDFSSLSTHTLLLWLNNVSTNN